MAARRIADFLSPESVIFPLRAASKDDAIGRLVEVLPGVGGGSDRQSLKSAMLARERAGSTGLGGGVAVPHARSARIVVPVMAVGIMEKSIDFGSADGQPVTWVFLLAVPDSEPAAHLKVLAALSRIAGDKKLLQRLHWAFSAGDLYEMLADQPVDPGVS